MIDSSNTIIKKGYAVLSLKNSCNSITVRNYGQSPIYFKLIGTPQEKYYDFVVNPNTTQAWCLPSKFNRLNTLTNSDCQVNVISYNAPYNPDMLRDFNVTLSADLQSQLKFDGVLQNSSCHIGNVTSSVSFLPPLPSGNNLLGKIRVESLPPLPSGNNNIGNVGVDSLPPLPSGNNNIGNVGVDSLPPLPSGNNNIGSVNVESLPPLPSGNNNIGNVGVDSLPPLPSGNNNIGSVNVESLPPLPSGNNNIGSVNVESLPPLPSGNNNIGNVGVDSLPPLPSGNNNIGNVGVDSLPYYTPRYVSNSSYTPGVNLAESETIKQVCFIANDSLQDMTVQFDDCTVTLKASEKADLNNVNIQECYVNGSAWRMLYLV